MYAPFYPRYEEEINKRTAAENEFVGLKKVSELGQAGQGFFLSTATATMGRGRVSSGAQGPYAMCGA